jgi:putative GTP pyrophosphokinase
MRGSLPDLSDDEIVEEFLALDGELNFMRMLRGVNAADQAVSDHKNYILVFGEHEGDVLKVLSYPNATGALRALFELERDQPGLDAVLVKGDTAEDIREAFKNYFSDARNFIELVENGCAALSGRSVATIDGDDFVVWDR